VDSVAKYPSNGAAWMHVAATWDGSSIRLYINGIQDSSKSVSFTLGNNTGALLIGAEGSGLNMFKGQMDDVRIYKTVLSPAEILMLATP
jgi:hypothetical protein